MRPPSPTDIKTVLGATEYAPVLATIVNPPRRDNPLSCLAQIVGRSFPHSAAQRITYQAIFEKALDEFWEGALMYLLQRSRV